MRSELLSEHQADLGIWMKLSRLSKEWLRKLGRWGMRKSLGLGFAGEFQPNISVS